MQRPTLSLVWLAIFTLVCAIVPARGAAGEAVERYIVELTPVAASLDQTAGAAAARRDSALAAAATAAGAPLAPVYLYTRALDGFALDMTPAQAAAVAAMPGVAAVQPDWHYELHSDAGPAFIGAARPDQGPALFFARLSGAQAVPPAVTAATGHAVATYDGPARALTLRLFYSGLSGPPIEATLRRGAPGATGPVVHNLAGAVVGAPATAGGFLTTWLLTATDEEDLTAGRLYLTIGTATTPEGELRGQLTASRGAGVVIGIVDTGIDPDHPSFADQPADGHGYSNPLGRRLGVCSPDDGDGRFDPSFPCNEKLIGAYTFADTAGTPDPQGRPSPRDNNGHGSHVAGIAAGNLVPGAALGGVALGTVAGVAPHANLVIYDVCGVAASGRGCSGAAILAAIDQAIADGVQILNLSLGGEGKNPWQAPDARALLRAVEAGSFVATSAGNSGPQPGTIGAPGNAPWVAATGSASHNRRPGNSLRDFAGGDPARRPAAPLAGLNIAQASGQRPIVDAGALTPPNARCEPFSAAQGIQVRGAIVVCQSGGPSLAAKAANAVAAGAAGLVVSNDASAGENLDESALPLPGLLVGESDGLRLRAWLVGCSDCRAAVGGFARELDQGWADRLDETSARGPSPAAPGVLKPDLVAPGVAILAAGADSDPFAVDFAQLSGTSMAAPHVAGLAALLRQIHPDWTPAEIRSAMALTAVGVRDHQGAPAELFARGAGRISAGAAAMAGFVLDVPAWAYAAADPAAGGDPASLNLPSLVDPGCVGGCRFTRTLRSTLGLPVTWTIEGAGDGFTLTTEPPGPLTLGPGETKTVTIVATITDPRPGATGFGSLRFSDPGGLAPAATMPVAIALERSNLPRELAIAAQGRTGITTFPVRTTATDSLTVAASGLTRLQPEELALAPDPTPGDMGDPVAGGIYQQVLTLPAGNLRFRAQLAPETASELALLVYADSPGPGFGVYGSEDSLLCATTASGAGGVCDLVAADPLAGRERATQVTILVQNRGGSGAARDPFRLSWGRADRGSQSAATNLGVSGPDSVPAGQPFELRLAWQLPDGAPGDTYIGLISLGSSPEAPGDLGTAMVTLVLGAERSYIPLVVR